MWRLCGPYVRYLNSLFGATRPFRKSTHFGRLALNLRSLTHRPRFRINLGYIVAISFPLFWNKSSENQSINEKRHFRKIIKIIKTGKVKEFYKDYDEAERLYQKALKALNRLIAWEIPSDLEISQTRSYILDCMANLSLKRKDFDRAESLFKEVLKELIANQKFELDDNAVVEISFKLAIIYANQNKHDNAELGYKFCLDTMENKLLKLEDYMTQADRDSLAMYGLVSESYSKYLILCGKWEDALPYLQKSFVLAKNVYEDAHPQVAVISNDLGVTFLHLNMLKEALEHFEFSVEVCKQCGSPDLPAILYNLGDLLMKMNESEKAFVAYREALEYCSEETSEEVLNRILLVLESESSTDQTKPGQETIV